ncbi:transcription antitermination factor NusB [Candidatus Saccharibacteria bacterium CG_4_10_14_0_2_um_filter_52_9]|nr:MAG: transcription antitermination factor NusB [Candidatus Saccharibacteria bacterium CG_4_10_14_0_2_um_filter_52_9]
MASNRHLGRIIALQTLYEQEMRQDSEDVGFNLSEVLNRNIVRYENMLDDVEFVNKLVLGVTKQSAALDAKLQPVAPEWPIDQIARMDRLVLRIGLYELENEADVPPKVVINEAVELAKAFGGDNSSKFVNGVLGTLLRQRDGDPEEAKPAKAKKPAAKVKKPTADATKVAKSPKKK